MSAFSFLKVEVESNTQGCHSVVKFLEVHGCMYLDIWTEMVKPYICLYTGASFNFSKIWKRKQHSGMLFSWSIFWSTWTHVLGHLSRSGWIYRCSTSNLVLALTLRKVVSCFQGNNITSHGNFYESLTRERALQYMFSCTTLADPGGSNCRKTLSLPFGRIH